jgi:hypothetical protein
MKTEQPNQDSSQQKGRQRHAQDTNRQDTSRRGEDLSQGSETLDDVLQEDQRDHSDNGRGQRGVLNR